MLDRDAHLSINELVHSLATGVYPGHVEDCDDCAEVLAQARRRLDSFSEGSQPEPSADCLSDLAIAELATGARHEDEWLTHLAECGLCCHRLKSAITDLSSELTLEELASIEKLSSSSLIWQSQLVAQMIGPTKAPRREWSLPMWVGVLAAGLAVAVFGSWYLYHLKSGPGELLAAAYTEMRPFDYRIADKGYSLPKAVREAGLSPLSKPESLFRAETDIAAKLRGNPVDHDWLRWRGEAELLELSPDAAVESLKKAHTSDPQDREAASALAVAYALRAEGEKRPSDYAFALELLTALVKSQPIDARLRFNRALVFERMRLNEDAIREWNDFLALDNNSEWTKEARQHLSDLVKQRATRDKLLKDMREGPEQFLARTGTQEHVDGYIDHTAIVWMAQAQNDPAAREALARLGDLLIAQYGDPWLKDAAHELGSSMAGGQLLAIVNANMRGDADAAMKLAEVGSRQFTQKRQPALGLRSQFDGVYASHRALKSADCVAEARSLKEEAERRSYKWLAIQAQSEEAGCLGFQGNNGAAIAQFQEALDKAQKAGLAGVALRVRGLLTSDQVLSGNPWRCWTDCMDGLEQYWQTGYAPNRAHQLYFNLASASEQLELPATAFIFARAAMEQFALTENRPTQALGYARVGAMALKAGYAEEASRMYHQASSIAVALKPSATATSYQIYGDVAKAQAEVDRGNLESAMALLRKIEEERKRHPEQQPVFIVDFLRELVSGEVALRSSDYSAAQEHLTKALAFASTEIASLKTEADRLRALEDTSRAPRLLMEAMLMAGRDPVDVVNVWLRFQSSAAESGEDKVIPAATSTGRLVYVVLNKHIAAWDLSGGKVRFQWLKPGDKEVEARADRLLNLLSDPSQNSVPIDDVARSLYQDLIAPFAVDPAKLHVLKILADSGIARVPFSMLVGNNGKYLSEEVPTVLAHRIGADAFEEKFSTGRRALIVANPSAGTMLAGPHPFLPEVSNEGRSIAQFFTHSRLLLGDEAKLDRLDSEASQAEIVHFAGHGFSNNGNGGLVMADGLLTSRQILSGPWARCRLVVLSACLTATGELRGPANPESLVRALQISGVPAVVAARWSVDSVATRHYMEAFYRSLVSGESVAGAVRIAQADLRSRPEYRHPYYWGAFQAFE